MARAAPSATALYLLQSLRLLSTTHWMQDLARLVWTKNFLFSQS